MEKQPRDRWYYRGSIVLLALFILGPLAFPLLWKSPHLGFIPKLLLTVLVAALTVYLLIVTGQIAWTIYQEMSHLGLE